MKPQETATRGHLKPRLEGRARRPRRAGISAHRDGSPYPNPVFHAVNKSGHRPSGSRRMDAEDFFRGLAGSHGRLSAVRPAYAGWMQRISFAFGRGCCAEITGRYSDGGASRTTRAGLVSASGRPRSAHAEKMPVGFRAAQIQKKSSLASPLPTHHPQPTPAIP